MGWRSRSTERLAYRELCKEYFRGGARWVAAPPPRLSDASYTPGFVAPEEDEPQRFLPTEYEPMFDAADAIKCGRDVFVARSSCCNRFGIEWLQRHLGDEYAVHEVEVHDTHPMHIDATFQPLAPGKLLINPERVVRVPEMFEKSGWDILVCPEPEMPETHPMYNCSRWIMMNVVMLDETRVVVSAGEKRFARRLKEWGFEPDRGPLLGLRDHRRRFPLRQRRHPPPRRPQILLLSRRFPPSQRTWVRLPKRESHGERRARSRHSQWSQRNLGRTTVTREEKEQAVDSTLERYEHLGATVVSDDQTLCRLLRTLEFSGRRQGRRRVPLLLPHRLTAPHGRDAGGRRGCSPGGRSRGDGSPFGTRGCAAYGVSARVPARTLARARPSPLSAGALEKLVERLRLGDPCAVRALRHQSLIGLGERDDHARRGVRGRLAALGGGHGRVDVLRRHAGRAVPLRGRSERPPSVAAAGTPPERRPAHRGPRRGRG